MFEGDIDYMEEVKKITNLENNVRGGFNKFSVRTLYKFYKNGQLEIQPFFQRNYVVENKVKFQTDLFKSIIQNWTINVVHMQELKDSQKLFRVIDGQQRVKTIFNFLDGKIGFSIRSLSKTLNTSESKIKELFIKDELLESNKKKKIKKITAMSIKPYWYERILDYKIEAFIYGANLTLKEIVELFRRMNSNNTKLNDMEIRRAIINATEYYSNINTLAWELFYLRNYYRKKLGLVEIKRFSDKRYTLMETLILFDGLMFGLIDENAGKITTNTTTPIVNLRNWGNRATLLDLIVENRKKIYDNNPELKEEHMNKLKEVIRNFKSNVKQLYPNQYVLTASYYSEGRVIDKGFNTNLFIYYALILGKIRPKLLQRILVVNDRFDTIRDTLSETVKQPSIQKIISVSTSNRKSIELIYHVANNIAKEILPEVFTEDKVNMRSYRKKVWNEYVSRGEYPICHICGEEIRSFEDFELDHVIPESLGGATSPINLKPAHKHCNRIKQDDILLTAVTEKV